MRTRGRVRPGKPLSSPVMCVGVVENRVRDQKMNQRLFVLMIAVGMPHLVGAQEASRRNPENALHARPAIRVRVGHADAEIIGADHRALQAAVDYVGNLGGGVVEIGPGEYLMGDSLHLRSRVTVRGSRTKRS